MTLDDIEQLERVATPGPWRVYRCSDAGPNDACGIKDTPVDADRDRYQIGVVIDTSREECHHAMTLDHATLIAAMRNALPHLLAVVRAADAFHDCPLGDRLEANELCTAVEAMRDALATA